MCVVPAMLALAMLASEGLDAACGMRGTGGTLASARVSCPTAEAEYARGRVGMRERCD